MKRGNTREWYIAWVICSTASALLVAVLPATSSGSSQGAPRIEFAKLSFNFGTMYQHEDVSYKFVFRNLGDDVLKITKVRSTCGCTAALPAKRELGPGERSEIKMTFRSGTMQGTVTKKIYVECNDPAQPRITLTVTGTVKAEVKLTPQGVYVGKMQPGDVIERSVEIRPVGVRSFRILEVTSDHHALRAGTPVALTDKRGGYRLDISFGPVAKPGRVNGKVVVRTDLEHSKELTIRVYGSISDPRQSP
jgi:hypothetical protein